MKHISIRFKKCPAFLALLISVTLPLLPVEQVSNWEWKDVDKVVAVGDIHGMIKSLKEILRHSELVDESFAWRGGTSHLVLCGDLIGRGEYEKDVLDLVMKLEIEALKDGGQVHVVLGNHDVMNLARDLRYVKERNYADYVGVERAADRRSSWEGFKAAHAGMGSTESQTRSAFNDRYPPGYFGRLQAFSSQGVYGSWLAQKPAVIKINDVLFVHGGLTPEVAELGLEGINQHIQQGIGRFFVSRDKLEELMDFPPNMSELRARVDLIINGDLKGKVSDEHSRAAEELSELMEDVLFGSDGPLWYRGYAIFPEVVISNKVNNVLEKLDAKHIVLAHTPSPFARINSRYQSKILRTDVAMVYAKSDGQIWGFLIYEGGEFKALGFRDPSRYVQPNIEDEGGEGYSGIMEQLPPRQLEDYLRKARIGDISGKLREERVNVTFYDTEYNDQRERVAFNAEDEKRDRRNPQKRLRSYKHMVAAYRISRILEYNIVPPSIIRKVDGREGSFVLFPGAAVSKPSFKTEEKLAEALEGMEQDLSDARAFKALLDIEGQDERAKMMLRRERRILFADLTQGFSESPEIQERYLKQGSEILIELPLSPFLELKLRELDRKELRKKLKGLISNKQIDALLARRDRLLEYSASLK